MQKINCSNCGHETVPGTACPGCGHAAVNGVTAIHKPAPPPVAANWVIEHASPDVLAWATQTFNEAEFLAAKREAESTGGVQIDDLIAEIERKLNGKV